MQIIRLHCRHRIDVADLLQTLHILWSVCVGQTGEPCKNGWTDQDATWEADLPGLKEPCTGCGCPWRIRLNYLCTGAMRPYVKLLQTTCSITSYYKPFNITRIQLWIIFCNSGVILTYVNYTFSTIVTAIIIQSEPCQTLLSTWLDLNFFISNSRFSASTASFLATISSLCCTSWEFARKQHAQAQVCQKVIIHGTGSCRLRTESVKSTTTYCDI